MTPPTAQGSTRFLGTMWCGGLHPNANARDWLNDHLNLFRIQIPADVVDEVGAGRNIKNLLETNRGQYIQDSAFRPTIFEQFEAVRDAQKSMIVTVDGYRNVGGYHRGDHVSESRMIRAHERLLKYLTNNFAPQVAWYQVGNEPEFRAAENDYTYERYRGEVETVLDDVNFQPEWRLLVGRAAIRENEGSGTPGWGERIADDGLEGDLSIHLVNPHLRDLNSAEEARVWLEQNTAELVDRYPDRKILSGELGLGDLTSDSAAGRDMTEALIDGAFEGGAAAAVLLMDHSNALRYDWEQQLGGSGAPIRYAWWTQEDGKLIAAEAVEDGFAKWIDGQDPPGSDYEPTPERLFGGWTALEWSEFRTPNQQGEPRPPKGTANNGVWPPTDDIGLVDAGSFDWIRKVLTYLIRDAGWNFLFLQLDYRFPDTRTRTMEALEEFINEVWIAPYFHPQTSLLNEDADYDNPQEFADAILDWHETFLTYHRNRMWAGRGGRKIVGLWLPDDLQNVDPDYFETISDLVEPAIGRRLHFSDAGHNAHLNPDSINRLFFSFERHADRGTNGWAQVTPGFWPGKDPEPARFLARDEGRFDRALELVTARPEIHTVVITSGNEWGESSSILPTNTFIHTPNDGHPTDKQWDGTPYHADTSIGDTWGSSATIYLELSKKWAEIFLGGVG